MDILKEQLNRAKELMGVITEQRTYQIQGQNVSREEWLDYVLRNYLHIDVFKKQFKEQYIDSMELTDIEKEKYCKLLPPVFNPKNHDPFNRDSFKGDAECV